MNPSANISKLYKFLKPISEADFAAVTGGAGSLALASARAFLEHGASGLALLDLPASFNDPDVQAAISQLQNDFPRASIQTGGVDVTDPESVDAVVDEMKEKLGLLNILVCFAGIVNTVLRKI